MSTYYKVHFDFTLLENIDPNIVDLIKVILGVGCGGAELPNHVFFKDDGYLIAFNHSGDDNFNIKKVLNDRGGYRVLIFCEIKNYIHLIDEFIDWVSSYINHYEKFIGYSLRECDDDPTIYSLRG